MLLLLDIGNTRLKWATCADARAPLQQGAAQMHGGQPLQVFQQMAWPKLQAVWMSCVPRLRDEAAWRAAVLACCGLTPQIVLGQAAWQGLRSSYAQPQLLGVDRWLNMVALWGEQRRPFCVVGAGTALTFDRVDAHGQHRGGVIAPGFGSTQNALLAVTRTATPAQTAAYTEGLGQDSEGAIRQGAFFAAMGVIEHCLRAPGADANEQRILTGGDAESLLPHVKGFELRPHLVLEGLQQLARQ